MRSSAGHLPGLPGRLQTLHWGLDDPAEVEGTEAERRAAFNRVMKEIAMRLHAFIPTAVAR